MFDGMKSEQSLSPEDAARYTEVLEKATWIFAKTMPWLPHWYTLRSEWDDALFVEVVTAMRRDGVDELYGKQKKRHRVFLLNGYKYWTMENPVEKTLLINRKPLPVRNGK